MDLNTAHFNAFCDEPAEEISFCWAISDWTYDETISAAHKQTNKQMRYPQKNRRLIITRSKWFCGGYTLGPMAAALTDSKCLQLQYWSQALPLARL